MYVSNSFRVKSGESFETTVYTLDAEEAVVVRLEKVAGTPQDGIFISQTICFPISEWKKLISEVQKELWKNGHET